MTWQTLALLLIKRFATVSTGWNMRSSATPGKTIVQYPNTVLLRTCGKYWPDAPDPNTLAAPESFPFEDEGGDMVDRGYMLFEDIG